MPRRLFALHPCPMRGLECTEEQFGITRTLAEIPRNPSRRVAVFQKIRRQLAMSSAVAFWPADCS